MRVESICIVGGGSSGWMSAALLSKTFPDIEVALIEPEDSNPIGVGESTLGHFNRFLARLNLHDEDWMRECQATYKTSIAFKNFRERNEERFQYPFGGFDMTEFKDGIMRFFELQCQYGQEEYPPEEFARFANHNTYLAEECRITDEEIPFSNYSFKNDTAYHFDAALFGQYLKTNIAIPNGVTHLLGDVENVVKRPDGSIESIMTTTGGVVSADLFVDCTGFKSLLLEQHMGVEFHSYNDLLFNDRALATQIPYTEGKREQQMETYTDCVAMDHGWVWNIPLWHRVGTGYVYSSKYTTDDDAEREFREYLYFRYGPKIAEEAVMRPIKIKHGKHTKGWEKNVVGIGLSYGFLEPLESTGLMTTHENLIYLCDTLLRRNGIITKMDCDSYNYTVDQMIETMKNFVALHYSLSSREDNQYWSDCVNKMEFINPVDSPLSTILGQSGIESLMNSVENSFFNEEKFAGFIYITAGQGYRPINPEIYKERSDIDRKSVVATIHEEYIRQRKFMLQWASEQPTHYQYLLEHIYGTDEYLQEKETLG